MYSSKYIEFVQNLATRDCGVTVVYTGTSIVNLTTGACGGTVVYTGSSRVNFKADLLFTPCLLKFIVKKIYNKIIRLG